jgi:hypothetical protein
MCNAAKHMPSVFHPHHLAATGDHRTRSGKGATARGSRIVSHAQHRRALRAPRSHAQDTSGRWREMPGQRGVPSSFLSLRMREALGGEVVRRRPVVPAMAHRFVNIHLKTASKVVRWVASIPLSRIGRLQPEHPQERARDPWEEPSPDLHIRLDSRLGKSRAVREASARVSRHLILLTKLPAGDVGVEKHDQEWNLDLRCIHGSVYLVYLSSTATCSVDFYAPQGCERLPSPP